MYALHVLTRCSVMCAVLHVPWVLLAGSSTRSTRDSLKLVIYVLCVMTVVSWSSRRKFRTSGNMSVYDDIESDIHHSPDIEEWKWLYHTCWVWKVHKIILHSIQKLLFLVPPSPYLSRDIDILVFYLALALSLHNKPEVSVLLYSAENKQTTLLRRVYRCDDLVYMLVWSPVTLESWFHDHNVNMSFMIT